MYRLQYLPSAVQDIKDIILYISTELNNPDAASRLAMEFHNAEERIIAFPYANPQYLPLRPLKHEYRKLLIRNYIMIYWVNEAEQEIVISRVVYKRRNRLRNI